MKISVLTLRPVPGMAGELLDFYRRRQILEASGALESRILTSEDAQELVVTAVWPDMAAYSAWQQSPRRAELAEGMARFFSSPDAVHSQLFDVAHTVSGRP
ncbi:putative quinol monooxygenase [Streptomyces sp. NPDC102364]|uniref:putative quinol monooxygenase n=1 Tax=Streptomyces sp. NPDC102364 TaxID=3366161 RepID=UPI0037FBA6F2